MKTRIHPDSIISKRNHLFVTVSFTLDHHDATIKFPKHNWAVPTKETIKLSVIRDNLCLQEAQNTKFLCHIY